MLIKFTGPIDDINTYVEFCGSASELIELGRSLDSSLAPDASGVDLESLKKATIDRAIHALWNSGNKIGAIKFFRDETGLGLKETKDYVESLCTPVPIV